MEITFTISMLALSNARNPIYLPIERGGSTFNLQAALTTVVESTMVGVAVLISMEVRPVTMGATVFRASVLDMTVLAAVLFDSMLSDAVCVHLKE